MLSLQILRWCLLGTEILLAGPTLYLCILAVTATLIPQKRRTEKTQLSSTLEPMQLNFAILIPAHNEEVLLGPLLESLSKLAYPKNHYSVHVVADNCTDRTVAVAHSTGWVHVYERFDKVKRSKGYALEWLLQKLEEDELIYDAYLIFDADSIVEPNFLQSMAKELAQGAQALQGRYNVLNISESPSTILRWIALTLMNHMRPLARTCLGFSSRLTGNGMCFSRALLERCPWRVYGLSEDYQYYLTLIQRGERIHYVPDALVDSHMPPTFAETRTQDIRWESGYLLKMEAWQTIWQLLKVGLRLRNGDCFDAIAELLTPPLSLMATLCVFVLALSLLLWSPLALLFSLLLISGLVCHVGSALYLLRPPLAVYKVLLLYAPRFALWKLWVIFVLKWRKKHNTEWVRTTRPVSLK